MAPLPPLDPASLDAAFAWILRASAQASVIIAVVAAARLLLRRRLSPRARYALWGLLALPFVAPLLPAIPIPIPTFAHVEGAGASSRAMPEAPRPTGAGTPNWRVVYEPLVPALSSPITPTKPMNWLRLAGIIWFAGAVVLALRVVVTHARALRHARRAQPITDPGILDLLNQCRQTVGTRRTPRLVTAPPGTGPALLGFLRPHLLLPADAAHRLSPAELRFVFLHELVHLRRADALGEWLLTLLQVVHWFNPLIWLAARRCRADREIACDAAVVALAGEAGRADYGRTILRLATELAADLTPRRFPSPALGILQSQSPLERRLRMIAAAPYARAGRWPVVLVALIAVALVACTNQGSTDGQVSTKSGAPEAAKPQAAVPRATPETAARSDTAPFADPLNPTPDWTDITSSRDRTVAEERRDDPKNAAVRAQLDRVLPEVNFDTVPLTDVVDFFRDHTGANIFINWRALENAGIDRKAPVTARLRDVRFAKALSVVLESLGGATVPLGYTIDDGVITVSTGEDLDRNTITRVYDVRDLIVPIPDFQPPPAHEPPAAPRPDDPGAAARAKIEADHAQMTASNKEAEELIQLLRETVDPASWRDAGGSVGSIRLLQGQFIVTQKPENHQQIAAMLERLRAARGVQIVLETRLIAADDDLLDSLPPGLREKVAGQLHAGKDPVAAPAVEPEPKTPDDKAPAAGVFLTAAEVDRVLRAIQASQRSHVVSAPRITLFNGQSAYVLLMKQRAYVADYTIVKADDAPIRFEPVFGTADAGIMLSARATASADRTHAAVSLHPRLTHLAGIKEVPWQQGQAAGAEKLTVQRPDLLVSELRCTVSIPTNQTLLLGGLKGAVDLDGAKEPADKIQPRNVIMLVKPTVIVHRQVG